MIVDLYKSGMSLSELSNEYGIAKSTMNSWIDKKKEIKIDDNEVMTKQEIIAMKKKIARIKVRVKDLVSRNQEYYIDRI